MRVLLSDFDVDALSLLGLSAGALSPPGLVAGPMQPPSPLRRPREGLAIAGGAAEKAMDASGAMHWAHLSGADWLGMSMAPGRTIKSTRMPGNKERILVHACPPGFAGASGRITAGTVLPVFAARAVNSCSFAGCWVNISLSASRTDHG